MLLLASTVLSCSSLGTDVLSKRFKSQQQNNALEQSGLSSDYVNMNQDLEARDNRLKLRSALTGSPFGKDTWSSDCDCR